MSDKLLPCPYCGGEAVYWNHEINGIKKHHVTCSKCGNGVNNYCTKQDAIDRWNTRATALTKKDVDAIKRKISVALADAPSKYHICREVNRILMQLVKGEKE